MLLLQAPQNKTIVLLFYPEFVIHLISVFLQDPGAHPEFASYDFESGSGQHRSRPGQGDRPLLASDC